MNLLGWFRVFGDCRAGTTVSAAPQSSFTLLVAESRQPDGVLPSAPLNELVRTLPVLFVASLKDENTGVSTLELASLGCPSALALICGSTSAMTGGLRLSLNKGCKRLSATLIGLNCYPTGSTRKNDGVVPIDHIVTREANSKLRAL